MDPRYKFEGSDDRISLQGKVAYLINGAGIIGYLSGKKQQQ